MLHVYLMGVVCSISQACICMWTYVTVTQVVKVVHPEAEREQEERTRERDQKRKRECVWKNSFIFTPESLARPSMPIHFLELAIVSSDGTTHTYAHTFGSFHPTVKALQSCFYTETLTDVHARTQQRGNGKKQQLGGPFAPLQKLQHPRGIPLPCLNTLCLHVLFHWCVFVCQLICVWMGMWKYAPTPPPYWSPQYLSYLPRTLRTCVCKCVSGYVCVHRCVCVVTLSKFPHRDWENI